MSSFDRIYNGIKTVMLMEERFTRIDGRLVSLSDEVAALAKSHADLAQRVAAIEGYLRGHADGSAAQPRLIGER